jgi:beta-aspartyl-peptidase (threonine type)
MQILSRQSYYFSKYAICLSFIETMSKQFYYAPSVLPFILGLIVLFMGCDRSVKPVYKTKSKKPVSLILHGGAGYLKKGSLTVEQEEAYRLKLKEALEAGYELLKAGKSSTDVVVATLQILEQSPLFNAGVGSVLTHEGFVSMDASIMQGNDLNAGAVAGVSVLKSPIQAARLVMDSSEHVLLSGHGADRFGLTHGMDSVPNSYFVIPRQLKRLKQILGEDSVNLGLDSDNLKKFGTVGCVALDQSGTLSAGTTTGGMMNKKYGRIGDSPIIGAGTYASNSTAGISCTGHGEYFIRLGVAKAVSDLMEYRGASLEQAANLVIHEHLERLGGKGGLIAMDTAGNSTWEFNTPGMFRARMGDLQPLEIKMYTD